uniref:Uncharacterized protein n=1 Tax=Grammatophora oceanica TaxID=210454 RepID=A0A7S1VQS3_9STRA|mmetsp:Transcript_53405/g.79782  ORF Transcript_53405/g.79782 Transcript_53405/m.79782 type:complete len:606 (+) Transcript_53405:45-1862(+)
MKYVLGALAVSTLFVSLSSFLVTLTHDGQSASSEIPRPLEPMETQKNAWKRVGPSTAAEFQSQRIGNSISAEDKDGLSSVSRNSGATEGHILRDGDWPDPHPPFPPAEYLAGIPSHILTTEIVFCKECEEATGCRDFILAETKGSLAWSVVMKAQQKVSSDNSKSCNACDPTKCRPTTPKPLRFDEAAPRFTKRHTFELTTISREAQRRSKHFPTNPGEAWWVYNPSLIPLPESMKSPNVPTAVYLATHRVSVIPNSSQPWVFDRDHVAMTTLDEDFNILREIVVDPNVQRTRHASIDDVRLFQYNGTVYLSSGLMLLPFEVSMDSGRHSPIFWPIVGAGNKSELAVHNVPLPPYGVVTRMRHVEDDNVFRFQKKLNNTVKPLAKNVNYFTLEDGEFFAEVYPLSPRRIAEVSSSSNDTFLRSTEYVMGKYIYYNETKQAAYVVEGLSDVKAWRFRSDRGSACCIRIEKEYYADLTLNEEVLSQPYIMVGISHLKSFNSLPPDQSFGYLSRLYAISPLDGATVLATSGLFCLASGKEERYLQYINNEVYNCPMIHFVMSIAINPIDPSKVAIAYGIDDVLGTMMETTKRELALHLFSPIPNTELG